MCTVTVVPILTEGRVLLLCNRDEQRARPPALPPVILTFADRRAAFPVDPASGGTWLAITDAGLVFCLLNANPRDITHDRAFRERCSRGLIIPTLLRASDLDAACCDVRRLEPRAHPPFTLLAFDVHSISVATSDGSSLSLAPVRRLTAPQMFTSSGLGDVFVENPRRTLFEESVIAAQDPAAAAKLFHNHSWPDATDVSVAMSRPDARTVSRCTVELCEAQVSLRYEALDDSLLPTEAPVVCRLPVHAAEHVG